jgi:hypothetical protein
MRHSDYRGLEKNAHTLDEEYQGLSARSVDDHYNYPFSPNSSGEFMPDTSNRQEHSLVSFAVSKPKKKKKTNKDTFNVNKVVEEEPIIFEEKTKQIRGRLPSRDDTQFDMEPEDDLGSSTTQGKL